MKKSLIPVIILILSVSCKHDQNISIGFMVPTYDVARYAIDRDNFTAKANSLGAEVFVENANNDEKLQIRQAHELIEKGVKVLVIIPVNLNTAASIVRDAHDNGVKVVAYERIIRNSDLDYFVSFDHYVVGKEMAEYAIKHKPEGNYVMIGGDKTDNNAVLINKGQMEVLEPLIKLGKVKVLYNSFIEDWQPESANITMKDILSLTNTTVDVVLSANDGMAGGIIDALKKSEITNVLVTGLDAELPACKRIVEGSQAMTVYKPLKMQAELAAQVAMELAGGQTPSDSKVTTYNGRKEVPTISINPTVVDISNIRSTIIADGFHKESEVFGN